MGGFINAFVERLLWFLDAAVSLLEERGRSGANTVQMPKNEINDRYFDPAGAIQ